MAIELTSADPGLETQTAIRWMTPASGLWVATRRGEHAGVIERIDGTYRVRNSHGRDVGGFADLDSARAAIDHHVDPGSEVVQTTVRRSHLLTGMMIALNGAIVAVVVVLAALLLR